MYIYIFPKYLQVFGFWFMILGQNRVANIQFSFFSKNETVFSIRTLIFVPTYTAYDIIVIIFPPRFAVPSPLKSILVPTTGLQFLSDRAINFWVSHFGDLWNCPRSGWLFCCTIYLRMGFTFDDCIWLIGFVFLYFFLWKIRTYSRHR